MLPGANLLLTSHLHPSLGAHLLGSPKREWVNDESRGPLGRTAIYGTVYGDINSWGNGQTSVPSHTLRRGEAASQIRQV